MNLELHYLYRVVADAPAASLIECTAASIPCTELHYLATEDRRRKLSFHGAGAFNRDQALRVAIGDDCLSPADVASVLGLSSEDAAREVDDKALLDMALKELFWKASERIFGSRRGAFK